MTTRGKIRRLAHRALIVALLQLFGLSTFVIGLASALHAAPSPALAELCRVEASGTPARAPSSDASRTGEADCCAHACRAACAGAHPAAAGRRGDFGAIERAPVIAVVAPAKAREPAPRTRLDPFGARGPPSHRTVT